MDSIWSKAHPAENLGTRLTEDTCEINVSTGHYHTINFPERNIKRSQNYTQEKRRYYVQITTR